MAATAGVPFISRIMPTPRESIEDFLGRHEVAEGHRLAAAIEFADSMLCELGAAVTEWKETAARLQRIKCEMALPGLN